QSRRVLFRSGRTGCRAASRSTRTEDPGARAPGSSSPAGPKGSRLAAIVHRRSQPAANNDRMADLDAAARLTELQAGCTPDDALALFDALPTVRSVDLTGRWTGSELRTGHPMDGLLTASGWYGKQFDSTEDVHPLLF